ncbi:MAG: GntR family transcriptional regulator [Ruminococcaceae bacterium]|nr:GntR family transcriptional regulator [Oscillospiraceae bacterium]
MYKNFSGKRDVYLDIADRYVQYIKLGVIKDGEKLPSVREAAGELGVNPNTVAKAYALFEEQGYIRSIPKKGAFVIYNEGCKAQDETEARELLHALCQRGISKRKLIDLIEEVYGEND